MPSSKTPLGHRWLRVRAVARHLDLSPKYVYLLCEKHILRSVRFGPRTLRIDCTSVDEYIRAQEEAAAS